MTELAPYLSPILTAVMAFCGSWLAFSTKLATLETKIDNIEANQSRIEKKTDKHNGVIERTFKLEGRVDAIEKAMLG